MFLADDDVSTSGLCRILVEMANALFLFSWRILKPHRLFRNSRDDDRETGRGRSIASLGMLMPT
jgi:hypothetical protein